MRSNFVYQDFATAVIQDSNCRATRSELWANYSKLYLFKMRDPEWLKKFPNPYARASALVEQQAHCLGVRCLLPAILRRQQQKNSTVSGQICAATRAMSQSKTATVFWKPSKAGGKESNSPTKTVLDKTWAHTYQHFSENGTDLTFKAGSKTLVLSSGTGSEESASSRATESRLQKKYG